MSDRAPRLEADPADVICIRGYYAGLPQWSVADIWREDGQTLCMVERAERDAFSPPDATIYRYEMTERGARFTEVQWIDGSSWATFEEMRQASLDYATESREAKVMAEFEASEAKAVAEGAPSMVITNVNAMPHRQAAKAVSARLAQIFPDSTDRPLRLHRSPR